MIINYPANILLVSLLVLFSFDNSKAQFNQPVITDERNQLLSIQTEAKRSTPAVARETVQSNPELSESQKTLVEGSRRALLKTGMSETFFSKHFRLVNVFDKAGDRRVVWKFSINEYEATVTDSIGYRTVGDNRIDLHSVQNVLSSTADIKRTIPRARALRIMQACIGKFADSAVEYRAGGSGRAGLFLTASSVTRSLPPSQKGRSERERKRSKDVAAEKEMQSRQEHLDVVDEEEGDDRPPVFIATVNLETGRCVKGRAQAGPPKFR